MKMNLRQIGGGMVSVMLIVLLIGNFSAAFAWFGGLSSFGFSYPHLVQLTGTFYPRDSKVKQTGLGTLTVLVPQEQWTFQVQKVRDISGDRTPLGILKSIFPPILYFRGSASVMNSLEKPEIAGEPMIVRGYLYTGDRILQVTEVKKVPEQTK
jgi:hypothetical protein